MSIVAALLRGAYRLVGAKRAFALPKDEILKVIEKQNKNRGVFVPTDHKAHYETIDVGGFPCLIVRENPAPAKRAVLYFFGGGMVIGPDRGDLPVMRKLCRESSCDVWFPFYPLCTEHCITKTYDMVYECYRRMIERYGGGNVSTCGFSSGGALALGIAAYETLQRVMPKREALQLVHDFVEKRAWKLKKTIRFLLHIPGLYRCVPELFRKKTPQFFGETAGFAANEIQTSGGVWRIDMTRCPYHDACVKYGCPELCPCFCDSDDITYGDLHKNLVWHRTKTLGRGDDCCDFLMKVKR